MCVCVCVCVRNSLHLGGSVFVVSVNKSIFLLRFISKTLSLSL